jgi:tripartite-type tricarboxylate transporter receptor subunit TctC
MIKLLALLIGALAPLAAAAADWPSRPVRVVVPYAAGGQSDVVARVFAESLSQALGQQFFIENQTGAGGAIAAKNVARAEPDGYTLMITGWGTHVLAPALNKNAGFDPLGEFTHIAFIGGSPNSFVVHPATGVKTFGEFMNWVKSAPGGSNTSRRGSARAATRWPSSSPPRRASSSCTCRTAAAAPPWATSSPATPRWAA